MLTSSELRSLTEDLVLETRRLRLRRFVADDLETALAHELDPRIMEYIRDLDSPEVTRTKVQELMTPWDAEAGRWLGLVMALDGAMVGLIALRVVSYEQECVEIGFRIHPDQRRQGLTEEACRRLITFLFDQVGVHKVVGFCVADNQGSQALMAKLGMRHEGTLREYSRLGGRWRDEMAFGMLASDRPKS